MFRRDVITRSQDEAKIKNTLVKTPIKLTREDDTVKFTAYELNLDAITEIFPTLDNCFFCIGKDGVIRKVNFESGKIVAESDPISSIIRNPKPPKLISLPNNVTILYGPACSTTILLNSTNLKQTKSIYQRFLEIQRLTANVVIARTTPEAVKELDQAEVMKVYETHTKSIGKVPLKTDQVWTTLNDLFIKVEGNTLIFHARLHNTEFVETAKLKIAGFGFLKKASIHHLEAYPGSQLISFVMSSSDQHKAVVVDVADLYKPRILQEFKQVYDIQKLPHCPAFLLQQLGDTTHGKELGNQSIIWDSQRNELYPISGVDLGKGVKSRSPATGSLAYVSHNASKIHFLHSVSIQPQLKKSPVSEEKKANSINQS